MNAWLLLVLAVVTLILVPIAPQLIRLRIRIFRWLRWRWAVNLLESHFQGWVVFVRILLLVIGALLLYAWWVNR